MMFQKFWLSLSLKEIQIILNELSRRHTIEVSMMYRQLTILGLMFLLFNGVLASQPADSASDVMFFEEDEFLDIDEAFQISAAVLDNEFIIRWEVADGYYLYKHRFGFSARGVQLAEPSIPEGLHKTDEYFGEVEVYYKHIEITIPYGSAEQDVLFTLNYQGCADAGLCYTPATRYLGFEKKLDGSLQLVTGVEKSATSISTLPQEQNEQLFDDQDNDSLSSVLAGDNLLWTLITFLGAGLLLTFTPCVLPMVPILLGIIAGQGEKITPVKAFHLSFVYVQAMAITYAILGVLVAQAGSSLSGYMQSPLTISIVAGLFILLALSMFGLYELTIPEFFAKHARGVSEKQQGGNYLGVAVMGVISTLIVSPCTTAPLTAALLFIANSGDLLIGGLSLYFLGLGMGIPLLVIGVSEGRLIPRAGVWMESVKKLFGFIMLAMALYITDYLIPGPVYLILWGVLLISAATFFGAFSTTTSFYQKFRKMIAIIILLLGIVYIVGGAIGNDRLLRPLDSILSSSKNSSLEFRRFTNLNELNSLLLAAEKRNQPVMLDFFAEWCVACYEFEDYTFRDKKVQSLLVDKNVLLLQADVTLNTPVDIELLENFQILGLPSILFFTKDGTEVTELRATGYESAEEFALRLEKIFQ